MALLLLSIVIIGFVLFFYGIGLRYLGLIPLIFVGMFFSYYGATQTIKVEGSQLLQKYALYIAWVIIMAGLLGMMNFFGLNMTYAGLGLFVLNLLLWISSIIIDYKDGKILFQLGFYLSIFFLLMLSLAIGGWTIFFTIFAILRVGHLGIIAFIAFLVGIHAGVEKYIRYKLAILTIGTIMLVIFDHVSNMYLALAINSIFLAGLFYAISSIFTLKPESEEQKKEISIRRILAGERITAVKKHFRSPLLTQLYHFVESMPNVTKQILELFNILLIVVLILYYITHVSDFLQTSHHLLYRVTIVAFVFNALTLKKVGYNSVIQNLFIFLVINFAIYVSLFSYFNGDAGAVATWGIIWNVRSAGMIFYAHKVPMLAKIFGKTDYIYRIVSCIAAMVVNVILLISTTLPGELIFFLVLVYVGVQSMIIYYAARYLWKMQV